MCRRIPETVLWGIFESLVNVLCLLERGALPLPRAKVRPRNWMLMLHRDIKPENGKYHRSDAYLPGKTC